MELRKTLLKSFSKNKLFYIFIIFYVLFIGYRLVSKPFPFYDWDESLYIQSGYEMFKNKYFFFPMWQGIPWLDKPPLVPFLYALVIKLAFFTSPEISARVFTLLLSTVVLGLSYVLYNRIFKNALLSTLAVFLVSTTPIFLQRSQVVNLDIFLLVGWLGFIVFYRRFWVRFLFLAVSVFSKSLIGFYPPAIMVLYYSYCFFRKKIKKGRYLQEIKSLLIQTAVLLGWFVWMIMLYGERFWRMHIIESHFRRISSSIEFHFGERLFYMNLIEGQFGILALFAVLGLALFLKDNYKKEKKLLYGLFLFPWFIFLNLTKTKIFWYFYSVIPQFAFLIIYFISWFRKRRIMYIGLLTLVLLTLLYQGFIVNKLHTASYSSFEPYYYASLYARKNCRKLSVLLSKNSRNSFKELEDMGLTITTTKWWGSHPSIVYYSKKQTDYLYSEREAQKAIVLMEKDDCFMVEEIDLPTVNNRKNLKIVGDFQPFYLLKRQTTI